LILLFDEKPNLSAGFHSLDLIQVFIFMQGLIVVFRPLCILYVSTCKFSKTHTCSAS